MKFVKKIVLVFFATILILLLTYNIYSFVCRKILKKSVATVSGYATLSVVSGSMEPTLAIGDIIVIDTHEKKYQKGDIVTFLDDDGTLVTHRILSIHGKEMITKGDNNNTQDSPSTVGKIVGKYMFRIPKGDKIFSFFKNPLVILLILAIGILFSIFISIDKNGNIKLDEEEQEYAEFKKYLEKKNK